MALASKPNTNNTNSDTKKFSVISSINTSKLVILALTLCVLAIGLFIFITHNSKQSSKLVFTIDGANYYQSDIQKLISYPIFLKYSKDQSARQVYDQLRNVKAASKLGYSLSPSEISTAKNTIYSSLKLSKADQQKYNGWFELVATVSAINNNIYTKQQAGYSGYSYVFFYGQHLQEIPGYTIDGLGDNTLINQDKTYAKARAYYYYEQVKNNKMSPAKALSSSKTDMLSRGTGINNTNFSTRFSSSSTSPWTSSVYLQSVIKYISSVHQTGTSAVQIGQLFDKAQQGKNLVDMYYYFVYLDSAPNSKQLNQSTFNKELNSMQSKFIGYKS